MQQVGSSTTRCNQKDSQATRTVWRLDKHGVQNGLLSILFLSRSAIFFFPPRSAAYIVEVLSFLCRRAPNIAVTPTKRTDAIISPRISTFVLYRGFLASSVPFNPNNTDNRRFFAVTDMVLLSLLSLASVATAASSSDKRGLVFVPNEDYPDDNSIWVQDDSDITWYYNYGSFPSPAFSDLSQDAFEFVPMMWGVNVDNPDEDTFFNEVKGLVDSGRNITHVLGFNEPDGPFAYGGSDIQPAVAARAWVANFEPLGDMGIKLGLPACTGGWDGMPWLRQFLGNCSELVSTGDDKKNCTWDFIPVHWYDNFEGLASHIGERRAEYVSLLEILGDD